MIYYKSINCPCVFLHKFVKKVLQTYFRQYRPFFIFLLKFFATYIILTIIYRFYLGSFDALNFEVDGMTQLVATHSDWFLDFFYNANTVAHESQSSIKLSLDGNYLARIVEGCNAISVMILFVAFVIAFKGTLKHTLLFILAGIAIIHILNITRIGLLTMALLHYPQHEHLLHGVIFPLFIYGVVFVLWIFWVNKYSAYAYKTS